MKPASTTRSGLNASISCASAASNAARLGVSAVIDDARGDAVLLRDREPGGLRFVADHRGDRDRQPRLEDRLHVAATPRDQDDDVFHTMTVCASCAARA